MGPLRSGPRGGTGPWGQYKTPDMLGSIRAQRGRARSALFYRVTIKRNAKCIKSDERNAEDEAKLEMHLSEKN